MTLGPSLSAFVSFLSYRWLFNVATSFVNSPKGTPLFMDVDTPDDLFEKEALKKSMVQCELGYLIPQCYNDTMK